MKNTVSRRRSQTGFRPSLELLETRLTPSTFTVANLNDSGTGSLRQAIMDANSLSGPDIIDFSVAGTIRPASAPAGNSESSHDRRDDGSGVRRHSGSRNR